MSSIGVEADSYDLTIGDGDMRLTLADIQAVIGEVFDIFMTRYAREEDEVEATVFFAGLLDRVAQSARPAQTGEIVLRGEPARTRARLLIAARIRGDNP